MVGRLAIDRPAPEQEPRAIRAASGEAIGRASGLAYKGLTPPAPTCYTMKASMILACSISLSCQ